ncbi:MAG: NB-ARC domain-containing protein [Cyanobacteria bacterium P01_D01_bin.156]
MEPDISDDFLASQLKAKGVTKAEREALILVLNGLSNADTAKRLGITNPAVRKRLGEVYHKFGIESKGPGKLARLKEKLREAQAALPNYQAKDSLDLGNAPRVSYFVGRQQELSELCQWIQDEHCDLIALTGMGGIGKTTLAVELAQQLKHDFELIAWRSVKQHGSFANLLKSLSFLDESSKLTPTALLKVLAQKRCLLILDQFECLFRDNAAPANVNEASRHRQAGVLGSPRDSGIPEDVGLYQELLDQISGARHQNPLHSCVVIVSREKPQMLIASEGDKLKVRLRTLIGLKDSDARHILHQTGLDNLGQQQQQQLLDCYAGNPLALKLAATTIRELFAGSIQEFFEQNRLVFDDLRDILKQQFDTRLTALEKEAMYWLAINGSFTTFHNLRLDIVSQRNRKELVYTLRSLEHRALIDVLENGAGYKLQPVVMEYVTQHLAECIISELTALATPKSAIASGDLLLNSHSLLKANADWSLRDQQTETLLIPVLEALKQEYGSTEETQKKLETILDSHRQNPAYKTGYFGGNLFNLMAELSKEANESKNLSNKNFSDLAIWQADLEGVKLTKTKFNNCNLEKSVFTEMLSDVVSVNFTYNQSDTNTLAAPYVAAGDTNGHIHIWNALTYKKRTYWQGHLGWVRSLAFNRDNTLLATGGDDSRLKLWRFHPSPDDHPSLNNISLVWEKDGFPDWVRSVAFHPKQEIIACCSHGVIYLYDELTHQEIVKLQTTDRGSAISMGNETLRYIAFSPNGDRIASCGDDMTVRVWDWQSGEQIFISSVTKGHTGWARSVAFSSCGRYLVSSGDDQTVRLWDLKTQSCIRVLKEHTDRVRSVAVSPNDDYIASGSDDGTIILWDFNRRAPIGKFPIHKSRVWSVAFYQHNRQTLLASGGDDRSVVLSKVSSGQHKSVHPIEPSKILRGFAMGTRSVAVLKQSTPKPDLIISGGNDWRIKLWQQGSKVNPNMPIRDLAGHTGRVWSVAAHGYWVASASDDGTIRIWNLQTSCCVKVLTGHQHWVRTVAFNHSGTILASGADDQQICLWQLPTGRKLRVLAQHQHWIRAVAFSGDGRYLASGGDDKIIYLWNPFTGKVIRPLQGQHQHRIRSVAFRPIRGSELGQESEQSLLLASGSDDGKVIIWNAETGDCLHRFEEQHQTAGVKSVAFSPDGCWMATGSDDHRIYVWEDVHMEDPKTWKVRQLEIPMLIGQPLGIQSLVFTSDSRHLVSCDRSGTIYIIDIISNECQPIRPPRPYENMEIRGITGIDPVQRVSLKDLGAVDTEELNLSS